MSESEDRAVSPEPVGSAFVKQLRFLLRRSWKTIRQSRLGMAGSTIVLIFALIALLAPWISPYPKNFIAPAEDRFTLEAYNLTLPPAVGNASYQVPVMGPTTPLSSDRGGAMWEINWAATGYIRMDLMTPPILGRNVSPFQAGNESHWFDIQANFTLLPPPGVPLRAVYYIVPGKNAVTQQFGPSKDNGLLAFFAGRDFIVVDPFLQTVIYRDRMDFDPVYTGEDPASSGNLLVQPFQQQFCIGILCAPFGPYRYFYASDLNHTAVYEITYVHAGDPTSPFGTKMFEVNETLTAHPFVYYNQERVSNSTFFRGGIGEGVLMPLANNTLEVRNVNGTVKRWIPLTLGGEPAHVRGDIGFTRSTFPLRFYLPLVSASHAGLAVFDLPSLVLLPGREFLMPDASWEPEGQVNAKADTPVYPAFYRAANNTTFLVGLSNESVLIPQFRVYLAGRLVNYFESDEAFAVIVLTETREIFTISTSFSTSTLERPQDFAIIPPKTISNIVYGGAFGGTLYGSGLGGQEVNGVYTDPVTRTTVVFQLVGTTRTPLAPGVYDSGKRYILGTDFIGHDILTQIMWGTQIAFLVGILAALFAVGIGTIVGLVAGYYGSIVDTLLMRTTDIFLVLPFLPLVLILDAILKPSIWTIILVLSILGWPGIARVIRAQALTLKERPFVDAARVSGASDLRLIFLHIAPNVLPFSFLYMSLTVASAIITEAALSFLGLGDATVISWGGILSNVLTTGGTLSYWWWLLPPGLCITFLSLGFYLLGRGFDEIINPRLRRR